MPITRIADKLVYFAHVPRAAGTAVERYLRERFGLLAFADSQYLSLGDAAWTRSSPQHIPAAALERLFPQAFFDASFAVVRDPATRLRSVFLRQRDIEGVLPPKTDFHDWLESLPLAPGTIDNHYLPMGDLIPKGAEVFRLEEGLGPVVDWLDALVGDTDGPREIEVANSHIQRLAQAASPILEPPELDAAAHALILERYRSDFTAFGYPLLDRPDQPTKADVLFKKPKKTTPKQKVILHVGPHKTGSTAIQVALKNMTVALRAAGYRYDNLAAHRGGAHRLGDLLSMERYEEATPYVGALQPSEDTLILSSENFSRLKEEQVRHFVSTLAFDEIRVVYYLRNPLKRLLSEWRELVKHGYRHTFIEFIAGRLVHPLQDRMINDALKIAPWVNVLGKDAVDIHLYDRIDNVAEHFLRSYCPELPPGQKDATSVNQSSSPVWTEILRALAGYQWHLLFERSFDEEIAALEAYITKTYLGDKSYYLRDFSLSMDNIFLRMMERNIATDYAQSIKTEMLDGQLFDVRNVTWQYLSPEIWLDNPSLTRKLFVLRKEIENKSGPPTFDSRLAAY